MYMINGVPVVGFEPNEVMDGSVQQIQFQDKLYDGFYVSYNSYDKAVYGCVTTALVLGQFQKFFILKGDHRKQYERIIQNGFEACLSYYKEHMDISHPYSDKLEKTCR